MGTMICHSLSVYVNHSFVNQAPDLIFCLTPETKAAKYKSTELHDITSTVSLCYNHSSPIEMKGKGSPKMHNRISEAPIQNTSGFKRYLQRTFWSRTNKCIAFGRINDDYTPIRRTTWERSRSTSITPKMRLPTVLPWNTDPPTFQAYPHRSLKIAALCSVI